MMTIPRRWTGMPRQQSPAESTTTHRAKQDAQDTGQHLVAKNQDTHEYRDDPHRADGATEHDKTSEPNELAPTTSYQQLRHMMIPYEWWHFLVHQASPRTRGTRTRASPRSQILKPSEMEKNPRDGRVERRLTADRERVMHLKGCQ